MGACGLLSQQFRWLVAVPVLQAQGKCPRWDQGLSQRAEPLQVNDAFKSHWGQGLPVLCPRAAGMSVEAAGSAPRTAT